MIKRNVLSYIAVVFFFSLIVIALLSTSVKAPQGEPIPSGEHFPDPEITFAEYVPPFTFAVDFEEGRSESDRKSVV